MSIRNQMFSDSADEDVHIAEMLRSGEASRLRRRGAIHGHGHHHPRPPYVTLTCGAPIGQGWGFVEASTSKQSNPLPRYPLENKYPPNSTFVEFTSSGCGAVVTRRAAPSRFHRLYEASPPLDKEAVAPLESEYLDEGQRELVEGLVQSGWDGLRWEGLGCRVCGNVLGFRFRPMASKSYGDSRSQTMFFPSSVTSSKPCELPEVAIASGTNHAEGISSPSRSPRRLRSSNRSSPAAIRLAHRARIDGSSIHRDSSYSSHAPTHYAQSASSSDFFDWYANAQAQGLAPLSDEDDEDERATVVDTELDHEPDSSDNYHMPTRYWTEPFGFGRGAAGWDQQPSISYFYDGAGETPSSHVSDNLVYDPVQHLPEDARPDIPVSAPMRPLVLPSLARLSRSWLGQSSFSADDETEGAILGSTEQAHREDFPFMHVPEGDTSYPRSDMSTRRTSVAMSHPAEAPQQTLPESVSNPESVQDDFVLETIPATVQHLSSPEAVVILEASDLPSVPRSPPQSSFEPNLGLDVHTPPVVSGEVSLQRMQPDRSLSAHSSERISRMYALRTPVESPESRFGHAETTIDTSRLGRHYRMPEETSTPTSSSAVTPPPRPPRGTDPRFRMHSPGRSPLEPSPVRHGDSALHVVEIPRIRSLHNSASDGFERLRVHRTPTRRGRSRETSPDEDHESRGHSRSWRVRHDHVNVTSTRYWTDHDSARDSQEELHNEITTDSGNYNPRLSSSSSSSDQLEDQNTNNHISRHGFIRPTFRERPTYQSERFRPDIRRSNSVGRAFRSQEVFPARPVFVRTPARRTSVPVFIPPPPSELASDTASERMTDGDSNVWWRNARLGWNAEQEGSEDKDDETSPGRAAMLVRRHSHHDRSAYLPFEEGSD
ncbi:hypothetical protein M422DRAFT_258646 [Sphaerobolus stellatus SS14]|uniref:Uncharacterized protein n=1 Tax=Sphaerobolus stellatus (strain SS14) TaxID=990650 RepID=A0A0C9UV93_SPHS4|nr:hypothetical protein M422DRAFT_258646 [Sphaerobolus stellatus SS14]